VLPASLAPAVTTVHPAMPPSVEAPAGARRRVLVVDDEPAVAKMVAHELELERMDVVVADSGREALEILERDRDFDVVLCDLMMPEMSGADLYQAVRELDGELGRRFAFMSGGAFTERAARFLDDVSNPRIAKPFHLRDLLALVRRVAGQTAAGLPRAGSTGEPPGEAPHPGAGRPR
jgi:two-component system, NtrC family, sensor kinase